MPDPIKMQSYRLGDYLRKVMEIRRPERGGKMKPYFIILLCIVLLISCAQAPSQGQSPQDQSQSGDSPTSVPKEAIKSINPAITLVKSGGLAGKTETITIYPDGRVLRADGSEQKLSSTQVSDLLTEIKAIGFFELKDAYGGILSNCNDCFTYEITVTDGSQTKTIKAIEGSQGTPQEIWQIVEKIQSLTSNTQ